VVQPVKRIVCASGEQLELSWDAGNTATLAARLSKALTDIQYGATPHEWSVPFE
jgi:hypothetical protein